MIHDDLLFNGQMSRPATLSTWCTRLVIFSSSRAMALSQELGIKDLQAPRQKNQDARTSQDSLRLGTK